MVGSLRAAAENRGAKPRTSPLWIPGSAAPPRNDEPDQATSDSFGMLAPSEELAPVADVTDMPPTTGAEDVQMPIPLESMDSPGEPTQNGISE